MRSGLTQAPNATVRGRRGCVASADSLATQAGIAAIESGGNAVDAAIATNAVMAAVAPHLCGLGGDLFALVHAEGRTYGLNASGRAPAAADAASMRRSGLDTMPFRHDLRSVTVPGCVDGWVTLSERFGSLPLGQVLSSAVALATDGFPASPLLVASIASLDERGRTQLAAITSQSPRSGHLIRLPGVARTFEAIIAEGRAGYYQGEFGRGLIDMSDGWFTADDLSLTQADWVEPLSADAFGVTLSTIGPNSQGYLALATARLADTVGLPDDPDDPRWAHILIEAATAAGFDRPERLHDRADGAALIEEIDRRVELIDPEHASSRRSPASDGDTTYLCTADGDGMAVSLIQSNASGFGSWLAEPSTGIGLHNRGIGFSLEQGHPAELAPGRRPPHTLVPMAATRDGQLVAVFGTMGGDAQPQIMAQLAARLFHHQQSPQAALNAGRWAIRADSGFDTWTAATQSVAVEGQAPESWAGALRALGHRVDRTDDFSSAFGHAHAIVIDDDMLAGGYDPRTIIGSAAAI